ncbi:hypothetical protein FOZ60_014996 [Perkinsus olseni]|uniref:Uncharacterized protein n=1 Tax=Perkinsus olseni TaxID=32597 RepID=A0A7J6P6M0_PEROL|nr:hypothetical protein FOZ60_014996 [Perkinsus olseni]
MAQDLRALIDSAIEERRSRHQRAEPAHGLRPMTTPTPEVVVVAAPTSPSSTTGSSTTASTSASITATTPEANEYEGHHRKRQQHHRHHEPKPSAGEGDFGESLGYGNGSDLAMLTEHSQSEYNYAFDFTFDEPEKQNEENDDPGGPNLRGKAGESGRVGHREPMLEPEKPEELPDREHPVTDSPTGREIPQRRREIEPYPFSEPPEGSQPSDRGSPETADEELGEERKRAARDVWSPHSAELDTELMEPTNLPGPPLEDNRDDPPITNHGSPLFATSASETDRTTGTSEARPLSSEMDPTTGSVAEGDDDSYTETVEEVGKEDTRRTFGDEEPYSETVEEVGRPETRKTFGDRLDVKELEKLADEEPSEQEVLEAFKSAGLEEAFSTASKGEG